MQDKVADSANSTSSMYSTSGLAVALQYIYIHLSKPMTPTLKRRALRSMQMNPEDSLEQFCTRQEWSKPTNQLFVDTWA